MKEIKEDLNKWRDSPCLLIGKINLVMVPVLSKVFYRFNTIQSKSQQAILYMLTN